MKKMIVGLALASASFIVMADTWVAKSKAGGDIILSDRECSNEKRLMQGYNVAPGGETLWFCWGIVDGRIMAAYTDGSTYTYNPNIFTKVSSEKPKNGGSYAY